LVRKNGYYKNVVTLKLKNFSKIKYETKIRKTKYFDFSYNSTKGTVTRNEVYKSLCNMIIQKRNFITQISVSIFTDILRGYALSSCPVFCASNSPVGNLTIFIISDKSRFVSFHKTVVTTETIITENHSSYNLSTFREEENNR